LLTVILQNAALIYIKESQQNIISEETNVEIWIIMFNFAADFKNSR